MRKDTVGFDKAVAWLAREVGMALPTTSSGEHSGGPRWDLFGPTKLIGEAADEAIFRDGQFEAVLGTAAKILIRQKSVLAASLLANAQTSIRHWEYDNLDGGQNTWRLYLGVPVDTYLELTDREEIQKTIDGAIATAMHVLSERDFIDVEITTDLEHDPDWREKTRQALSGEGINNQGRAHSQNVAAREYDGLRFRSRPEIFFFSIAR